MTSLYKRDRGYIFVPFKLSFYKIIYKMVLLCYSKNNKVLEEEIL